MAAVIASVVVVATLILGTTLALTNLGSTREGSKSLGGASWVLNDPISIPSGTPVLGTPQSPIPWTAGGNTDYQETPVSGGIVVSIAYQGVESWQPIPGVTPTAAASAQANVSFQSFSDGDGIGLGCLNADGWRFVFYLYSGQAWALHAWAGPAAPIEDAEAGNSTAILPLNLPNHVAVACTDGSGGSSQLLLEVNGSPVANVTVANQSAAWSPMLTQCSCGGPDAGEFTGVVVSTLGS